jgi:hypothetical protein
VHLRDAEDGEERVAEDAVEVRPVPLEHRASELEGVGDVSVERLGIGATVVRRRMRGRCPEDCHAFAPTRSHERRRSWRLFGGRLRPRRRQLGVLSEDPPFQLLQRATRLDAQLLDELPARVRVDLERLPLPSRSIESQHQLTAEPLAQRLLGDEALELRDELGVPAAPEVGVEPVLERDQTELFQAADLDLERAFARNVDERRAAPERERLPEDVRSPPRIGFVARLGTKALEALEIELVLPTRRR